MKKNREPKNMSTFGAYARRGAMFGDSSERLYSRMLNGAATRAACIRSRADSGLEDTGRKIGKFFGKK